MAAAAGTRRSPAETPPVDLLEEAVHLLRGVPLGVLLRYYLGTVPFVLALLFFWADMSRNAYAAQRCAVFSFLLALLFLWMKCAQAAFARGLWQHLGGRPEPRWLGRAGVRLIVTQAFLQPVGLILLPLTMLVAVPFPWVFAYYQNLTVFALDDEGGVRVVHQRAVKQATLWPAQNFHLQLILSFFGLFVLLNIGSALVLLPQLLRIFFGVQTRLTVSSSAMFNTTFLASVTMLAWLCLDPLVKAVYVLRCFYGESLSTGEALRAELSLLRRLSAAALLGVVLLCGAPRVAAAPEPAAPAAASSVAPAELGRAITETISQPVYAWRMPRERLAPDEESKSFFDHFLDSVGNSLSRAWRACVHWCDKVMDRLIDWLFPNRHTPTPHGGGDWHFFEITKVLLYTLAALVLVTLAYLVYDLWRKRPRVETAVAVAEAVAQPDLRSEDVAADQLPSDGWIKLAEELLDQGEPRLALRALYLAGLAALAQGNWIRIRKSKSNREYERELSRRAHSRPGLLDSFRQNVFVFERVWYGLHTVSGEMLAEFKLVYERIRQLAG